MRVQQTSTLPAHSLEEMTEIMVSGSPNMLIGYPGIIYSDMYIPYAS